MSAEYDFNPWDDEEENQLPPGVPEGAEFIPPATVPKKAAPALTPPPAPTLERPPGIPDDFEFVAPPKTLTPKPASTITSERPPEVPADFEFVPPADPQAPSTVVTKPPREEHPAYHTKDETLRPTGDLEFNGQRYLKNKHGIWNAATMLPVVDPDVAAQFTAKEQADLATATEDDGWDQAIKDQANRPGTPEEYLAESAKGVAQGAVGLVGSAVKGAGTTGLAKPSEVDAVVKRLPGAADLSQADFAKLLADIGRAVPNQGASMQLQAAAWASRRGQKYPLDLTKIREFVDERDVRETDAFKTGDRIQKWSMEHFGPAPGWEKSWTTAIATGGGSTLPFVAASFTGFGIPIGVMGGMWASAGEQIDDAIRSGATPDQIKDAARLGQLPGLTEQIPIEVLFSRIPIPYLGPYMQAIGKIATQAAVEGGQEGAQQMLLNWFAQLAGYDPDRPLMQDVPQSTVVGAIVGGGVETGVQVGEHVIGEPTETVNKGAKGDRQPGAAPPPPGARVEPQLFPEPPPAPPGEPPGPTPPPGASPIPPGEQALGARRPGPEYNWIFKDPNGVVYPGQQPGQPPNPPPPPGTAPMAPRRGPGGVRVDPSRLRLEGLQPSDVSDIAPGEAPPVSEASASPPPSDGGMPAFMTPGIREQLAKRGYSTETIRNMRPDQAQEILKKAEAVTPEPVAVVQTPQEVEQVNQQQQARERVAPFAPPPSFIDTRGKGKPYHGTAAPIAGERLDEGHYESLNYYGNGFYTSDAFDIVHGYTKKGRKRGQPANPTYYQVEEIQPVKALDMEQPIPDWLVAPEVNDTHSSSTADAVLSALDDPDVKNVRQLYDAIREYGTAEGLSADTIQEQFEIFRERLLDNGYGALDHTGGLRTNRPEHKVRIYLDAHNQVRLTTVNPDTMRAQPLRRISFEVAPGEGSPNAAKYGEKFSGLPFEQQSTVSDRVLAKAVEIVNRLTGIDMSSVVYGTGGWETYQNPTAVAQTTASAQDAELYAAALGYLLQQTEVWINHVTDENSNAFAVDFMEQGSKNLSNNDRLKELWATISAADPTGLIKGYQPITDSVGRVGIRVLLDNASPEARVAVQQAMAGPILDAINNLPYTVRAFGLNAGLTKLRNDWTEYPNGQEYLGRLAASGLGSGQIANLDNLRGELEAELQDALGERPAAPRQPARPLSEIQISVDVETDGGQIATVRMRADRALAIAQKRLKGLERLMGCLNAP